MKISVILPAYNCMDYVSAALDSVWAQSVAVDELICVNDASTDNTLAFLQGDSRLTVITHPENRGPAVARNTALAAATGDIIALIDGDDLWPEGKLAAQVASLSADEKIGISAGYTERFYSPDSVPTDTPPSPYFNAHLGSFLIRKAVFDEVGVFDPDLRKSEDQDWFLRAREHGVGINILPRITLRYRLHPHSMTHGDNADQLGLTKVMQRALRRRRQTGRPPPPPLSIPPLQALRSG
ncbi:MAG: hypothetical protein SynsKO_35090 [Synoicihabitans sp.]